MTLPYQYRGPAAAAVSLVRARFECMKSSAASTTPTAEKPALTDEQRKARLKLLAERLLSPDGLDRDTLARGSSS